MSSPRPVNTPWLVPYLTVCGASAVIASYRNAFGFGMQDEVRDRDRPIHVEMTYQGQLTLMLAPEDVLGSTAKVSVGAGFECSRNFHLYCDDVDTTYQHALDQGVTSIMAPYDAFWDERYAAVRGPDGHRWGLAYWSAVAWSRHRLIVLPDSPQGLL